MTHSRRKRDGTVDTIVQRNPSNHNKLVTTMIREKKRGHKESQGEEQKKTTFKENVRTQQRNVERGPIGGNQRIRVVIQVQKTGAPQETQKLKSNQNRRKRTNTPRHSPKRGEQRHDET
jgi:hypothetical protein